MHTSTHTRIRVHYCLLREQLVFSPSQFVLNPRDRSINSVCIFIREKLNKINLTQASKLAGCLLSCIVWNLGSK
jgi:hypothetical protein